MKKLGCAKCGGTKKMKLGGSAVAKAPVNMFGIPQENMGTSGQMGFGRKGGTLKKEHPITTFRKANEARQVVVNKSLPKAEVGMSTGYTAGKPIIKSPSNKYNPGGVPKGIDKPIRTNNSKTPAAPRSTEPVRKPSIEFGDPNVGFKYNKPQPKTKYEDAVINTKSSSTKTAAKPVSGYTPKRGATTSVKKTVGPKPRSTASAIKAGMTAGPVSYAISNMFKKKGGTVKSKKK